MEDNTAVKKDSTGLMPEFFAVKKIKEEYKKMYNETLRQKLEVMRENRIPKKVAGRIDGRFDYQNESDLSTIPKECHQHTIQKGIGFYSARFAGME